MPRYFAKLDQFNNVLTTVVGNDDFLTTFEDDSPGKWLECDKQMAGGVLWDKSTGLVAEDQSKAFRLNWPGVGWVYDPTLDGFIEPRPVDKDGESCASWTLNNSTGYYEPPIARPEKVPGSSTMYVWDESVYQGDNTKGWVEV